MRNINFAALVRAIVLGQNITFYHFEAKLFDDKHVFGDARLPVTFESHGVTYYGCKSKTLQIPLMDPVALSSYLADIIVIL
jgi:hypothetical protein